jgi:hypothetical protein
MSARWSPEDKDRLRRMYGTVRVVALLPFFPGRSKDALTMKAFKMGLCPKAPPQTRKKEPRKFGWSLRSW